MDASKLTLSPMERVRWEKMSDTDRDRIVSMVEYVSSEYADGGRVSLTTVESTLS